MEIRSVISFTFLLLFATCSTNTMAQASGALRYAQGNTSTTSTETPGPGCAQTYSRQTYVLSPGSEVYNSWKAWIERKNAEQVAQSAQAQRAANTHYASALETGAIGVIAITVQSGDSTDAVHSGAESASRTGQGAPMAFPATGSPSEHITIVNSTTTLYQRWVYVWQEKTAGGRAGDWVGYQYVTSACAVGSKSLCKERQE